MKQLSARASAEEAVNANREKQEFILHARSLRRLGEWAASEMMGKNDDIVTHYAETLVKAQLTGIDPVPNVAKDLRSAGFDVTDTSVGYRFDRYLNEARKKEKEER